MPVAARGGSRPLSIAVIVAVCVLLGLVGLVGAGVARAAGGPCSPATFAAHEECLFGSQGSGPGQFEFPRSVAVNQTTGDVYVLDDETDRVDQFTGEGVLIRSLGEGRIGRVFLFGVLAVDQTSGDVYVLNTTNGRVEQYSAEGAFQLEYPSGGASIAVGPTGTVYVGEFGAVQEYNASGEPVGSPFALEGAGTITDLVVNAEGEIYTTEAGRFGGEGPVRHYPAAGGSPLGVFDEELGGSARSLVLDPVTGEIFVNQQLPTPGAEEIRAYSPTGVRVAAFANTSEEFRHGFALDESTGALDIASQQGHVTVVFPPPPGPVVSGESVGSIEPTAAVVHANIDPETEEAADETHYRMEYGLDAKYGSSAPLAEGSLPGSFNDETIPGVRVSGLKPGTAYHFRVVATDQCEKDPVKEPKVLSTCETDGKDETFTTQPPAKVEEEWVTEVGSTSAELHAVVSPLGSATTYRFVYGPTGACGGTECSAPIPNGQLGSGKSGVPVEEHVQGLTAGETYHYRVVAENALSEAEHKPVGGAEQAFTTETGGEPGLPDSREWELVSPPDKHGALIEGANPSGYLQAADVGNGIVYPATAPTEARPHGNGDSIEVLARRTSAGWSNLDLAVSHGFPVGVGGRPYVVFSSDLSLGLLQPKGSFEPSLSAEATEQTPYLRDSSTGVFTPLVTPKDDTSGLPFGEEGGDGQCEEIACGPLVRDATPDLSHVVLAHGKNGRSEPLLADTNGGLYEWSAGKLSWVTELPASPPELAGGPTLGGFAGTVVSHAVSDDGSRIFWSQPALSSGKPVLFVRDMKRGETIEIGEGEFEGANAQGTLVFYSGHECEIPLMGALECKPIKDEHGEELEDGLVLTASEDGSWVYFQEGERIYVRHGAGQAMLVANDIGQIKPPELNPVRPPVDPWRASPNGQWFAFMSDSPLTGYDNHDAVTGKRDEEVYLYDAGAERLVCASCDPTGARPHGVLNRALHLARYSLAWEIFSEEASFAATVPGWGPYAQGLAVYDPRFISDSGRLFFNATDGLVPKDVNGQVDVYQYEPPGLGSCTETTQTGTALYSPSARGCVALISSGESPEESVFEDASETGEDVFFLSSSRLSTLDIDSSLSLWDAHACTTISPCLPAPATALRPCSTETSCKASPSPQPGIYGPPASATFNGPGNVSPAPLVKVAKKTVKCEKPKKLTHGKCVKPKSKKLKARKASRATHNRRPSR